MSTRSRPPRWRGAVAPFLVGVALVAGASAALASERIITRADALAVATAISVRHGDVPKLKPQSNPMTAQETAQSAQLTACVGGVPESEALADTQSPNFVNRSGTSGTLSSGTEILPSIALVAKDFDAITGPHGLPCLLKQLRQELVGKPPKGETVTAHGARLAPIVAGADRTFAYRVTVIITVTRKTTTLILPLYVDLIGFTYGQAEVSLTVEAVGAKPSASLERRLAAVLVARARSAIG
ncbi:MAG: hypothetical protein ABSD82_06495 [Solirubrobacteraceae bacterium]|jgi:hypothetical protein